MSSLILKGGSISSPTRVLPRLAIVDDDQDFLLLISDLGNLGHFTIVGSFSKAAEALQTLPKSELDLVLMDIHLPDISGIQCTKALSIALPNLPILALTGFPDASLFLRSVMAGAAGFLVKPFANSELLSAIAQALAGEFPISKLAIPYVIRFIRQIRQVSDPGSLTEREEEVLACTLMGLQTKEIAQKLGIGEATVHTHVQRMHEKLNVHSKKEIIARFFTQE